MPHLDSPVRFQRSLATGTRFTGLDLAQVGPLGQRDIHLPVQVYLMVIRLISPHDEIFQSPQGLIGPKGNRQAHGPGKSNRSARYLLLTVRASARAISSNPNTCNNWSH